MLLTLILSVITVAASAQTTEWHVPKMRIAASGGLGYKTAKTPKSDFVMNQDKMKKYSDDMRWTPMVGGDIHYLLKAGYGFGVKYLFNYSSAEVTDLIIAGDDSEHYFLGDSYEKMYVNFVGPSFCAYQFFGNHQQWMLFSSVAIGYAHMRDESGILFNHVLTKGGTVGIFYDLGIEYFLNQSLSVGLNIGVFSTTYHSITQTDGTNTVKTELKDDNVLSVSNINLNAGIRYYINK